MRVAMRRAALLRPAALLRTPHTARAFSASTTWRSEADTVALAYESYAAPADKRSTTDAGAVVLCHGLFGSKQNWRSLGKAIAQRLALPVYAVDLRNHGTSPHTHSMRYDDMASDVLRFFDEHAIRRAVLVGHSMGGKTVQSLALRPGLPSDYVQYLVSVDMSPARGALSKEFEQYVEAMLEVQAAECTSRQQADAIIAKVEPDVGVRQFLLTNLTRDAGEAYWRWRIPIATMKKLLHQIGDFPYDDQNGLMVSATEERPKARWDGQTLFVKGAKSKYINRKNIPLCDAFFPNAQHITLDTGHWVQAEKPMEFVEALAEFVGERKG